MMRDRTSKPRVVEAVEAVMEIKKKTGRLLRMVSRALPSEEIKRDEDLRNKLRSLGYLK